MDYTKCSITCSIIICILIFISYLMYLFYKSSEVMYIDDDHEVFKEIKNRIAKINPELAKIPIKFSNRTFIIDKSVIYLCIHKEDGTVHDTDTVMYAYVHELAHALSKSVGHGDEFKKNNSLLLNCGHKLKILNGHHRMPSMYCGVSNS